MRHKERIDVKNIREKEIVKVVSIGQKDIRFRLQNAYVGQVGDNTELLDETLVDNMLELMAKAVKTNYSKYNPVPNEITVLLSLEASIPTALYIKDSSIS